MVFEQVEKTKISNQTFRTKDNLSEINRRIIKKFCKSSYKSEISG